MAFDPGTAVAEFDPQTAAPEPEPVAAKPEAPPTDVKEAWAKAGPGERFMMLIRGAPAHYDKSVEEAFTPSDSQPKLPRAENFPDLPNLGLANPSIAEGAYNAISGAANSILTPGAASMANPAALAYAMPYFAKQAGASTAKAVEILHDKNSTPAETVEALANAGFSIGAAVAPAHILGRVAERGIEAVKPTITDFKPVEAEPSLSVLNESAKNLEPEAALADKTAPLLKPSQAVGIVPSGTGEAMAHFADLAGAVSDKAKAAVSEVRDLPEFTPFKEAVNEWFATRQINSLATLKLVEDLQEKLPDKTTREAITNYIQAGGDEAALLDRAQKTNMDSWKKAYEKAANLSPEEKVVADDIRTFYADKLKQAQDWGVIDEGLSDYVNQVWREPVFGTAPARSVFGGRLSQTFRSAKERTFENFFEGEQAGFKPATKDITELMALYSDGLNKAIATRKLVKDLTEKTAEDGRPLAAPVGAASMLPEGAESTDPLFIRPRSLGEEHNDYRLIDNPALYKWKFLAETTEGHPLMSQGQLGIHPDVYGHVKDMLGRSEIREWYDKPSGALKSIAKGGVKALDYGGQLFKGMSLGFLSPFHQIQEATHAIGHKINPLSNLPELDVENPILDRGVRHGLALAGENDAMQLFGEGLGGGTNKNPLWKLPVVGKWAKDYSTWLFHDYIPKLKLKTYEAIEQRNMERYANELASGKAMPDDVMYLSAQQTNAAYGHLNYADIGRNPTLQHMMQMVFLAPDFLEARGRFTGQAAKGLASKVGREQLSAMATLAATFWITARILNKTVDNDYNFDHPFEVRSGDRWYSMRSVPEDIYKAYKDTRVFASNRLSPIIGRGVLETATGRNYRGEKISFTQEMRDIATRWIPISFQNSPLSKTISGTASANPISVWEQLLSTSGLQVKRASDINDAYALARDWKKKAGKPEDTGTYPVSKYQALRYALEDRNLAAARTEYEKLTKEEPSVKVINGFRSSLTKAYAGSRADDKAFIASLSGKDKETVNRANVQRREMWNDFLKVIRPYVQPSQPPASAQ